MSLYTSIFQKTIIHLKCLFNKETFKCTFKKALESFKNIMWLGLKDTVHEQTIAAITVAQNYYATESVQTKKEELITQIAEKIELPLLLKPFKKLLKSFISTKVDNLITGALQKGYDSLT